MLRWRLNIAKHMNFETLPNTRTEWLFFSTEKRQKRRILALKFQSNVPLKLLLGPHKSFENPPPNFTKPLNILFFFLFFKALIKGPSFTTLGEISFMYIYIYSSHIYSQLSPVIKSFGKYYCIFVYGYLSGKSKSSLATRVFA